MNIKQNASYTDATNTNNLDFSENTKLLEKKDIANTPFKRIITEEGDFFTIGAKAITGRLSQEEADLKQESIETTDWKFMLSIISVIVTETVAQLHYDMMKYNDEVEKRDADVEGIVSMMEGGHENV